MAESAQAIDADEARELIAKREARVLDIRDADSFADSHISGALNDPEADADSLPDDLREAEMIIVVCEDGEQSAELATALAEQGQSAASLDGGIGSWESDYFTQPSADIAETKVEAPKLPGAGI
jgi:thiosulfate sulfurtransferase